MGTFLLALTSFRLKPHVYKGSRTAPKPQITVFPDSGSTTRILTAALQYCRIRSRAGIPLAEPSTSQTNRTETIIGIPRNFSAGVFNIFS
jgi:hypothetical protein